MTGPIDESRHSTAYVGESGVHAYFPKPYAELTENERQTIREMALIERWQASGYATAARPRVGKR